MADRKITEGTEITFDQQDPSLDMIPIVDVSDTTDSATGTTKKVKPQELKTDAAGETLFLYYNFY